MKRSVSGIFLILTLFVVSASGQTKQVLPDALNLKGGLLEYTTSDLRVKLVSSSQTVAALEPAGTTDFDFSPSDRLSARSGNGFYHLGDLTFSLRNDDGTWRRFSTATERKAVIPLDAKVPDLAEADLSPTLPPDCPIKVIRTWTVEDGHLALHFELINKTDKPIEMGALGIPLVFNNILTDRSLAEAHEKCSFSDPYIGLDAGYLQVTRLKGIGPALLVVPSGSTTFEGYQLLNEPTRPAQTFEGMFEWLIHTKAFAETTWVKVDPWNKPTSETLAPKARRSIGLKFIVADRIQNIEKTLAANGQPVAIGIPGYVLPWDIDGKLFVRTNRHVKSISSEPADSMRVEQLKNGPPNYVSFFVKAQGWGRSRLTIEYDDGSRQSINYYLTKPARLAVSNLGSFLFSKQWYEDPNDPFKRSPSVITYDRETNKAVDQDNRVWIAGLGDEGGSGSWVAAAMKEFVQPNADEIAKFERFIDSVLWGGIQYKDGPNKFGVRKSLFYYAPDEFPQVAYDKSLNWTTWASWKKNQAESIGRGYNYPHVVAAYWSMYRIARNSTGLARNHPWDWYLDQAYQTTKFLFSRDADGKRRVEYTELGLMEGTIFLELLKDLKHEGWNEKAAEVERLMKERADAWSKEAYPFGSEMAWDSTGQEEVYDWSKYFGYDDKASVSLNSIVGYMPLIPHWGYNGNARRYWDFLYAAKLRRIERQIHHYGSGLNAIPVLDYYRSHPDDTYMLRVGYAGGNAALTNIDKDGFASAAFHTYPDTLKWDGYSGDYGMNFFGYTMNAGTYLADIKDLGWQVFGGDLGFRGGKALIVPYDGMKRRIYLAPYGLWLTLDAGEFDGVEISKKERKIVVYFLANKSSDVARLHIEQPAKIPGVGTFKAPPGIPMERGAYVIPIPHPGMGITLTEK